MLFHARVLLHFWAALLAFALLSSGSSQLLQLVSQRCCRVWRGCSRRASCFHEVSYVGAVRTCVSKTYEQRQRPAIGPRKGKQSSMSLDMFRRCIVPTYVSLILTARARAKVSSGVLNVDFVCAGPDSAFQICLLARLEAANRSFRAEFCDWTAIGRRSDQFHQ